jgi:cytochrome P450
MSVGAANASQAHEDAALDGGAHQLARSFTPVLNRSLCCCRLPSSLQVVRESERVVAYLHEAAKSGQEIDFQRLCYEFTFDSICSIAFGQEMHTIGSKTPHPFGVAFDEIQALCTQRSLSPPPWWKLQRLLQFGSARAFTRHMKTINEFVYGIVADRKKDLTEYEESGDLLSLFLLDAKKRGETLTDRYTRDLIMFVRIHAHDWWTSLTHRIMIALVAVR